MKLNGFVGKGTGKLGSSVFAVSGGEQIVRQYNPNVSNPSTDAQVAQRAKFKLMSQIAADLAGVIAIPKQELKSSRNLFVSRNIGLASYENGEATIDATKLQLTPGDSLMIPPVHNVNGNTIAIELNEAAGDLLDGVVYVVVKTDDKYQMQVIKTVTVTTPGEDKTFPTVVNGVSGSGVTYAYGLKKGALSQLASYGNYSVEIGYDVATLVARHSIKNASGVLTSTKCTEWSLE